MPVKAGSYDFGTNRGTVTQGGSLRIKRGRHVVTVSAIRVTLGKKSKVVAKVAGRKLTLATLARSKQKVKSSKVNRSVANISFRLSAAATKRINKKLGRRVLSAKRSLGTLSVRVHKPAGTDPTTTTTVPADSSAAKIGFAPALSQSLAEAGLTPAALPGSEQLPDGSISLPVTSANIDPQTGSGTVDLAGGLTLGSGDNAITVDQPQIVIGGSEQGLYGAVNGVRVKLANLDKSGLAEAIKNGTTQLTGILTSLSPEGAAALNEAGGVSLFLPGTPFGDLSISLPSEGSR
jgi:hypothetical protein